MSRSTVSVIASRAPVSHGLGSGRVVSPSPARTASV